jgi:hypothetical protein
VKLWLALYRAELNRVHQLREVIRQLGQVAAVMGVQPYLNLVLAISVE